MKNLSIRLNDASEDRLNSLKAYYEENGAPMTYSYNDIIQLALRALSEDCGLE